MTPSKEFKNIVVFDCETKTAVLKTGFNSMEMSIGVAYSYPQDSYTVYLENEIPQLIQNLRRAELIVGFNQVHFDLPLLKNYDPHFTWEAPQTFDILKEFERVAGHRIKLDTLLSQTLGTQKSGHGLQAVEWYKQGEIQRIIDYCKEDVRQTKMLFDYIVKNGTVAYESHGQKKWVKISPPNIYKTVDGMNLSLF